MCQYDLYFNCLTQYTSKHPISGKKRHTKYATVHHVCGFVCVYVCESSKVRGRKGIKRKKVRAANLSLLCSLSSNHHEISSPANVLSPFIHQLTMYLLVNSSFSFLSQLTLLSCVFVCVYFATLIRVSFSSSSSLACRWYFVATVHGS